MVKCLKTLIALVYYILSDLFKCAARDKNYEQSFVKLLVVVSSLLKV